MPLRPCPAPPAGVAAVACSRRLNGSPIQPPRLIEDMSADRPAERTRDPPRPRRARARRPLPGRADGLGRRQHAHRRRRGPRARPAGHGQADPARVGRVGGVPHAVRGARCAAMSALSHPNIAAVHDWGEEQVGKRTTVYAVVEYLAGGSLRDLFDRGRYLDPSQALVVGLEACRALDFAHRKGLVHTELTPAKLVFGDDRRLRIVDFGLARLLGEHDWAEPATVATHVARYSSPEQALGQPIDGKTDVYSLALILVEAVTGTVPFAARSTVATLSARIGRLMPVSADLGPLAVGARAGRPPGAGRPLDGRRVRPGARAGGREAAPPDADPAARHRRCSRTTRARCAGPTTRPAGSPVRPGRRARRPRAAACRRRNRRSTRSPQRTPAAGRRHDRPRTAAAVAAAAAVGDRSTLPAAAPAAGAPSTSPTAAARRRVVDDESPRLYDGDADRTDRRAGRPRQRRAGGRRRPSAPRGARRPARAAGRPAGVASASLETLDDGRSRRRRGWPWLAGILVVVALAGLGYLAYGCSASPTHEVPELVGLDEEAAEAQTADFDWDLEVEHGRAATSTRRPAAIIRTAPAAGEQPRRGRAVPRRRQRGPRAARRCPTSPAQPLTEAETTLAELRLVALPADGAVRRDRAGRVGDLVVGAGGRRRSAPAARCCPTPRSPSSCPPVRHRGRSRRSSGSPSPTPRPSSTAMQLVAADGEPVFSDDIPTGNVVSVDAAAATEVPRGLDGDARAVEGRRPRRDARPHRSDARPGAVPRSPAAGLNVGSLLGTTAGHLPAATVAGDPADRRRAVQARHRRRPRLPLIRRNG